MSSREFFKKYLTILNEAVSFKSLQDAGPDYSAGNTQIWYWKEQYGHMMMRGYDFLKEKGHLPNPQALQQTHALVGKIAEKNLERIFSLMQGEAWSPQGEARDLIRHLKVGHTSMSVGDIIVLGKKVLMCDTQNFTDLVTGEKNIMLLNDIFGESDEDQVFKNHHEIGDRVETPLGTGVLVKIIPPEDGKRGGFRIKLDDTQRTYTFHSSDVAPIIGESIISEKPSNPPVGNVPRSDVENYGNWTVTLSRKPVVMPKLTGNTAQYVAKITHKRKPELTYFGVGKSQADAREDGLAKAKEVSRSANPDDFKSFTVDLNSNFTDQYFDPRSGGYFKFTKEGDNILLVMASPNYFKQFGAEITQLGFKRGAKRIVAKSGQGLDLYGFPVSKNEVKSLGLIPNMRYTVDEADPDTDGNQTFVLRPDTRTEGPHDKYRMNYPGLTVAGTLAVTENDEDGAIDMGTDVFSQNPTDMIAMDVPLFIRMLEFAKEDAANDMALHNVAERAIELMHQHEKLSMENYDELVGGQMPSPQTGEVKAIK